MKDYKEAAKQLLVIPAGDWTLWRQESETREEFERDWIVSEVAELLQRIDKLDEVVHAGTGGDAQPVIGYNKSRKVVAVTSAGVERTSVTKCTHMTTALCADGTLWQLRNEPQDAAWERLAAIPAN